ncbi:DUF3137 domain-containing protein [Candidatus Nomurabacteria bacterium]|nr:DUF3137 domain-containing protein [Candidatus Nomurabacteria bacterium]
MNKEFIKTFLSRSDVKSLLIKSDNKRKRLLFLGFFAGSLFSLTLLILDYFIFKSKDTSDVYNLITYAFILPVLVAIYDIQSIDPRNDVIPILAKLIDKKLFYEFIPSDSPDYLDNRCLVNPHDGIDCIQSHIKYETQNMFNKEICDVFIEGYEIAVSNNSSRTKITSHSYITEIKYLSDKFKMKNDVLVKSKKVALVPGFEDFALLGYKKEAVFLESNDFEKMFDVYCKDQIEVRELLNPHTMELLMEFIKFFNNQRRYDFYFTKSSIFVKYYINNINNSKDKSMFKVINPFKSFSKNTELYENFYLEFLCFRNLAEHFNPFYR